MIQKDGHYILNIEDLQAICAYFKLNPKAVYVQTVPSVGFIEYRFHDIFNQSMLLAFYDHDGIIRVQKTAVDFYELPIGSILTKTPDDPPSDMSKAISKNVHRIRERFTKQIDNYKNK